MRFNFSTSAPGEPRARSGQSLWWLSSHEVAGRWLGGRCVGAEKLGRWKAEDGEAKRVTHAIGE